MPVPKRFQELFGILVATFQKRDGLSLDAAKKKADGVIKDKITKGESTMKLMSYKEFMNEQGESDRVKRKHDREKESLQKRQDDEMEKAKEKDFDDNQDKQRKDKEEKKRAADREKELKQRQSGSES